MNLNWVKEDIEKKLEQAIIGERKSDEVKKIVYEKMLMDIGVLPSTEKIMIDKYSFFKTFDYFDLSSFNAPIFKLISYISSNIPNIDAYSVYSSNIIQSPEYVLRLCQDFYKKYNKDSLRYLKEILSKKNCIHFSEVLNESFFGRSYILSESEYYVLINGNNYLQNCLSCIHEFKHIENRLKGYERGIALYKELPSILYEFYLLDYLLLMHNNSSDISCLRFNNINKYLKMIIKFNEQIEFIKKMDNKLFYSNIYENYEIYYKMYDLQSIFSLMKNNCLNIIGYIISFIVSIDIYCNNEVNNINNLISCYNFGYYNMKPKIIDGVLDYISINTANFDKPKKNTNFKKKY